MRVVIVCPYAMDRHGGVQSHVRSHAAWLRRTGHSCAVIAPGPSNGHEEEGLLQVGRRRVVSLSGTRFEVTTCTQADLAKLRRDLGPAPVDIVHLHTPFVPFLPYRVWRALGGRTVATFHATVPEPALRLALGGIARWFQRRVDATIAVSDTVASYLRRAPEGRPFAILPPGVDLSQWRAIRRGVPERKHVLFLGRFEPRKGLDTLLKAWPLVLDRLKKEPPFLTLAGDGPLRDQVAAFLRSDVQGTARLVVSPSDAEAQLLVGEADVLAAPSGYGESYGLILMEAMAAGTPVVAGDNPGYRAALGAAGEVCLVTPGDAPALAERIAFLLSDDDARSALATRGRAHALQADIATVAPSIQRLYDIAMRRADGP
jgi:phosphatidylinositol alpha-mannosyltransferase